MTEAGVETEGEAEVEGGASLRRDPAQGTTSDALYAYLFLLYQNFCAGHQSLFMD